MVLCDVVVEVPISTTAQADIVMGYLPVCMESGRERNKTDETRDVKKYDATSSILTSNAGRNLDVIMRTSIQSCNFDKEIWRRSVGVVCRNDSSSSRSDERDKVVFLFSVWKCHSSLNGA